MKTCIFAGSFDPITNGHKYVIEKCLQMFDKVIVAIGENKDKHPYFSLEERTQMIKGAFNENERVVVDTFSGMLVDYMKKNNLAINVRGIRDQRDYEYETTMAKFNKDMYEDIITIYLPTPSELTHVSSSAVKNILSLDGDLSKYVPQSVIDVIKKRQK